MYGIEFTPRAEKNIRELGQSGSISRNVFSKVARTGNFDLRFKDPLTMRICQALQRVVAKGVVVSTRPTAVLQTGLDNNSFVCSFDYLPSGIQNESFKLHSAVSRLCNPLNLGENR